MLPAFGLYTHIRQNRIRSIFLIGSLFALVYSLTFAGALTAAALQFSHWRLESLIVKALRDTLTAAPYISIGTLVWVVIGYWFNQQIIDASLGSRPITREENRKLYDMLENLCISRGMSVPRFEILDTPVPNAFASGVNDKQYAITLTSGLIETLNDDELEAVIAHELTHIRNGDVKMMIVAIIVAGIVAFFAELFFRMLFRSGGSRSSNSDSKEKGGAMAALAIAALVVAVAWVLSLMIRLALSRSREFLADAGAVELTKNPDAMISALRRIEGKGEIPEAPSGIMEMCLDNPRTGFADLFSTHPSIDARVAALKTYAGGREELRDDLQDAVNNEPEPDAPPRDHIDQAGEPAPAPQPSAEPARVPGARQFRMPWGPRR